MRIIYIDSNFKCHTANDGTMTVIETDAFDGKCAAYIEGTRFVPAGMKWTREDGKVFPGKMIAPCVDSQIRQAAQAQYEQDLVSADEAYRKGVDSV